MTDWIPQRHKAQFAMVHGPVMTTIWWQWRGFIWRQKIKTGWL